MIAKILPNVVTVYDYIMRVICFAVTFIFDLPGGLCLMVPLFALMATVNPEQFILPVLALIIKGA